jgi:hypothetical protein
VYIQQDATLRSLFISGKCSTCFGWYFHPSSGAHTTVSTTSVEEQIEVKGCLLSFGAESFVFQVAIQKLKDQDIYNYNFAHGFVWV